MFFKWLNHGKEALEWDTEVMILGFEDAHKKVKEAVTTDLVKLETDTSEAAKTLSESVVVPFLDMELSDFDKQFSADTCKEAITKLEGKVNKLGKRKKTLNHEEHSEVLGKGTEELKKAKALINRKAMHLLVFSPQAKNPMKNKDPHCALSIHVIANLLGRRNGKSVTWKT